MNIGTPLDGRMKGVPVDMRATSIDEMSELRLHPRAGETSLPVLTLERGAFVKNAQAMFAYAKAMGVDLAPHAKTPMSPALCADLVEAGAWGLTAADARQTLVLLEAGFRRILLANQIGGERSGERLGRMIGRYPDAEIFAFVDSLASLSAIQTAATTADRSIAVLVEVGGARSGARTLEVAEAIIERAAQVRNLHLAGVAAYEGASAVADAKATRAAIAQLHELAGKAFRLIRKKAPDRELILSSGGSSYFDLVVEDFAELARLDGNARIVLRSGAIFFHDHGVYERGLSALDARGGFSGARLGPASEAFSPALRVWAEVLSRPEPNLAICGMGMRDVSFDQGFPRPLAVWRDGAKGDAPSSARVIKLNDQHAFLDIPAGEHWRVGDVVEFGISHPCTCLDRWRTIFELDEAGAVRRILPTFFG